MFLVIEEASGTTLEKIPFENNFTEPNADFEYRLDHKVTEATTGVSVAYNASTNISTFTVPYRLRASMNIVGRFLASNETSTFVNAQGTTTTLKPGQIVIMDEPTTGLDKESTDKVKKLIFEETEGKTLIIITHSSVMLSSMRVLDIVDLKG